ncbi:MAG: HYR domain-containing protein [Flavobacteriales bacterium]|nr:HYR domain-containing protein [Flavobacteriales bacterium]
MPTTLRHFLHSCALASTLFLSGPWAYHASAQTNTWDWANMPANGNNSVVHDMAVDSINGAIYVVGEYAQAGPFGLPTPIGGKEGFLARLNLNTGAVEWSVRMGGSGDDRTNGVVVGAGGRIFVTGWSQGSTTAGSSNALALTATALGGSDAFVAAYGPTGVIAWLQPAGGPWDDLGSDIALSDAGLSVLGSFERMITCGSGAGAIATPNVGNGGRTNVFLATWALDGSPQGLLYGTNAHDIVPQALATSAGTQYVSGTFGNAPLEWHAQDGTLLGATPSGTSMGNVFVAAISSVSNNLLWHRAISNPNDPEIAAYGLASDCDMVYVTGFAEQGARFTDGQAVSHPSSAEDYLYLAALSGMDGSPEWIRTAVSVDELKCAGVDIAVTASHDILLFGYFDERLRFDTGTDILGQQNQESAVIRFTPFGEIEWAGALSSNGDAKPTSIAVASFNGIILGGADQGSLQWGTSASVASGSQSPFVIKLTDTDASLLDGIRWRAPASLCSSSGPFDLSAGLSSRQRGAVTTVLGSVSVSAPNNIIGQPNGSGATMSTVSVSSMQLDLGQTLQAGDLLIFTWKRTSTGTATLGVQTSPDNVNYVTHSATPATASAFWVNQPFAVETTTRYLRIQLTSTIGAQIDAIRWIKGGPTDGEFSGTGVTHPILDPSTGGTGVRTISYTVSAGSCAFSTTRSITIDPSPSGTLSGPLSVCPGATTSYSLVSSNSSGQTWEISTNGGTNWTAVSSNPSSFDLSGISQPVQLRVVLASATCPVGTSNTLSIVPDNAPPTITGLPSDQALITGTSCGANFTWPRPSINDGCTTCDPGSVTGYTRLGVFNGHAYYLSTTTSYWPAANTAAQSTGGHLATISSVQENTWLAGITTGIGSYIGLNDIDNEGTWKWANGEPLTFTNWGPGRPNGWLLDDQDWGVLNAPSTGFWDDNGFLPLTPRRHLLEFDCAVWQTAGPASPATFPVGTTTVGYTAMDAQGNTSTASFHVVVSDGTKPIVTFPTTTVSIPASGWPGCSGLLPDLIPQATVDEACPVTLHQRPAPGASISNTDEVWIIATDASGNSDSLSVMVVLEDITPPVIASCPNGQTVVVANAGDPSVPFSYTIPTANDCSPVTASLETGYLPGALFPLGTTEVRWRFSDDAGRWSECSFMVTVGANDAPQLTCPTVPPVNTDPGSCTAVVNYPVPIGFDAQEGAINAILVPPSLPPGPFPVGSSLVTYTLQDLDGNSASCSFTVTVTDGEAPTITCPPSQSLHTAAFECSFPASWAVPVVTDNCPSCVPSAALSTYVLLGAHDGKQYYISAYDATYDAAIAAAQSMGHHLLSISTVEENDFIHASINAIGIDPVWIGLTDQIVEDEYLWHSGEPFVYENWVDGEPNNFGDEDAVMMTGDGEWNDVPVTITLPYIIEVPCPGLALNQTSGPPNGAPFPLGTTDVTYTVTDAAGRSADCLFSITIIDNIPPIFSNCPANDTLELVGNDCTTAYVFPTILSTDGNVCDGDTQSDHNTMVMLAGTTSELDVTGWSNIALPHGTHRFRETHADDEGNTSVCEWTITVEDVTAPEVVCLLTDSFPLYLNGDCDLAFPDLRSYVTAEDCNGATIDMFPEPGTLFHGENLVQMTMWITDSLGNGRPNNHTIWIHDNTAPTILCQDTLEVPSTNNCMGEVLVPGPILVEDNCGNPSWNVDAEDGMWPVGDSTVTYTVTDGRLTSTCSTVVRVLDGAPPTPTISADGPLAFCAGGSVTLTSSNATGNVWSTGETTQAGGPLTFCAGGNVTLTSSSATGNVWSTGATTQAITVSTSGTYSVTVTNGNGCSATSAGTTVTVNPNPATPTIGAGGPLTFCAGGSVTLTSSSATGNVWSTGATTQSITANASGNYSVTVTDGNGCSATSAGTTVTVNPDPATPTITAGGPLTFCAGGNVTLTSSSATGNVWSTGATTQAITVSTSGTYSVTVTNGNGCSATSAGTTVTVNPNPATPTTVPAVR